MTDKRIEEWNVVMYVCMYVYDCFKRFGNYFNIFFHSSVFHTMVSHTLHNPFALALIIKNYKKRQMFDNLKPIIQNMNRVCNGSDFYECK